MIQIKIVFLFIKDSFHLQFFVRGLKLISQNEIQILTGHTLKRISDNMINRVRRRLENNEQHFENFSTT